MSTDLFATHGAPVRRQREGEPGSRGDPGATPYARHAQSAASLACSGCVDLAPSPPCEALASTTLTAADLPGDGLDEVSGDAHRGV